MKKIVAIAPLFEPKSLESKIRNLAQCNLSNTLVYWVDCSNEALQASVRSVIKNNCKFDYDLTCLAGTKPSAWMLNWVIDRVRCNPHVNPTYLTSLKVDDLCAPDYFEAVAAYLDEHPGVVAAAPLWMETNLSGQVWPPARSRVVRPGMDEVIRHFPMWRADLHNSCGFFTDPAEGFWEKVLKTKGDDSIGVVHDILGCHLV